MPCATSTPAVAARWLPSAPGEHWDSIERVAEALSERGELSGDEVDALLVEEGRGEITRASGVPTRSPSAGQ